MPIVRTRRLQLIPALLLALVLGPAVARAQSAGDIERIKDEGMNRSQVMQTLSYLTDVIGPRLTASPNLKRANEWTRDRLKEWGLQNAHLEAWGPFGRGWSLQRFSFQVVEPQGIPLIAYPKAWSPGWKGNITGDVVFLDVKSEADLDRYKGKLKGAIVLTSPLREVRAHFESQGARYSDEQLEEMAAGLRGRQGAPRPQRAPGANNQFLQEMRQRFALASRISQFLLDEGAAVLVDSGRGDGGIVFVQQASVPGVNPFGGGAGRAAAGQGGANRAGANPPAGGAASAGDSPPAGAGAPAANAAGVAQAAGSPPAQRGSGRAGGAGQKGRVSPWSRDAPKSIPQVTMAVEHYNRLVRMLQAGEKVKIAAELQVKFYDHDLMSYNTIAEIPGTDLKDEVVMVGAHMDSWHTGTGATDNGAGCAVGMEAMRILQALGIKPRRTIRIGLWSGEEQGLMGSAAYVKEHFGSLSGGGGFGFGGGAGANAEPPKLETKPDYDRFCGYFNLDNGTGKIRGIYLQGNAGCKEIFQQWLEPFKSMGAGTVTLSNTGGTDHQSFDRIGLPGFQFIQDEIEYETRTHHSNMDVFDRIQADDMKQASAVMAAFLYNAAMRDEKLPRKPRPGSAATGS